MTVLHCTWYFNKMDSFTSILKAKEIGTYVFRIWFWYLCTYLFTYAIFIHVPIFIFAVMSEGLPSPNSTCNALFPGRTGHPKGTIQAPGDSDIFHRLEGPLTCTKSLVPSDSQSLTLTVNPPLFVSILLSWYERRLRWCPLNAAGFFPLYSQTANVPKKKPLLRNCSGTKSRNKEVLYGSETQLFCRHRQVDYMASGHATFLDFDSP